MPHVRRQTPKPAIEDGKSSSGVGMVSAKTVDEATAGKLLADFGIRGVSIRRFFHRNDTTGQPHRQTPVKEISLPLTTMERRLHGLE